ncbi:hypothetical protein K443DRAFT_685936 [Laccaria amethystina LaAM-08-1]|uniref:Uncharacterized protein n=1 Tax=Laccaria amethystina LaAM-08-1 TaxID=1095629 RepID=A0A0C9WN17_9AGAR|nr:hypothetical protein K443DRAFT_685936 [Laccaria amethystina LaAM-08-1]
MFLHKFLTTYCTFSTLTLITKLAPKLFRFPSIILTTIHYPGTTLSNLPQNTTINSSFLGSSSYTPNSKNARSSDSYSHSKRLVSGGKTKSAPCEGTCVVLTDLERHCNCSEPEECRRVTKMYVEKDLLVQLFGGGTTLNRAQRSSTRRRRGRRRKNVQELTPTSSTITFSLPCPPSPPHPPRLLNPPIVPTNIASLTCIPASYLCQF